MPKYQSDNFYRTDYPTLGITVDPGEVVTLPEGIDASGLTLVDSPAKNKKATELTASDDASEQGE